MPRGMRDGRESNPYRPRHVEAMHLEKVEKHLRKEAN